MLKVMLVDDNRLALEYFSRLIPWEEEGFELVCTAGDGEAALVYFEIYSPDVVITDVQMPSLDGIGLAKEIRARAPDTMVVFLSSYEEFSYIRSAMELGVFDYLLKHELNPATLRAKLRKIRETLESRDTDKRFIAEGALSSWLHNLADGQPSMSDKLTARFPGKYDLTIVMEDRMLPSLASRYAPKEKDGTADIRAFLYHDTATEAVLQLDENSFLAVSAAGECALNRAYRWKDAFRSENVHSLSFLLAAQEEPIISGITQYLTLTSLKEQKFFYPSGTVLSATMLRPQMSAASFISETELIALLDSRRFSDACQLLDRQYIEIQRTADAGAFDALCRIFCAVMSEQSNRLWDSASQRLFTMADPISDPQRWYDIPSAFSWLKERFALMVSLMNGADQRNRLRGSGKVLSYIREHYADSDLGADAIAGAFDVSVNRMNAMIKKETGSTLWQLLIHIRMEEAGRLLRTTALPISEIMEKTGYKTMSHFAESFRKFYRMTPSEYRRSQNETL